MSIADEISQLQNNLVSSYSACLSKGATMPANENFDNLSTTIDSIPAVNNTNVTITPTTSSQTRTPSSPYTGFYQVTVNAVTSSIDPNIQAGNIKKDVTILGVTGTFEGGGGPAISVPKSYVNGQLKNNEATWALPAGMTSIADYALNYAQYQNTSLTSATGFGSITGGVGQYGLGYSFYGNTALTTTDLKLGGALGNYACANMFNGDTSLTGTIDVSGITSIGNYGFSYFMNGCNSYNKALHFDSLTSVGTYCFQNAFYGCDDITALSWKNLQTISSTQAFATACYNAAIHDRYQTWHPFPKLTTINATSCFSQAFCFNRSKEVVFDKLEYIGNSGNTNNTFVNAWAYADFKESATSTNYVYGLNFPVLKTIGLANASNYGHFIQVLYNTYSQGNLFFPELTTIYNTSSNTSRGNFNACGAVKVYMPKVTNFGTYGQNNFGSSTTITELHFGKENQATIEALGGYSSKFGASNATIYFDLINHITVNGTVYNRQGANYDYDNKYYSWNNGDTVIYTRNQWTPVVGDATYTKSGTTYTSAGTISAVS